MLTLFFLIENVFVENFPLIQLYAFFFSFENKQAKLKKKN